MESKMSYDSGTEEEFELPVVASDGEPEVSEEEAEVTYGPSKRRKESSPLIVSDPDLARIYAEMSVNERSEDEQESEENESPVEQDLSESSATEVEIDSEGLRELQRRKQESDEENLSQDLLSSLDDIKTDEEMENIKSADEAINNEEVELPHIEDWTFEPEDYFKKTKIRKKLPKDSEDSESTEYESIKSGDEEHVKDDLARKKVYKPLVFNFANQDTFEIFEDYIDEYDNNFEEDFYTRYLSSASSSTRESDICNESCENENPKFTLIPVKPRLEKRKKSLRKKNDVDVRSANNFKKDTKLDIDYKRNIELLQKLFPFTQTPLVYEINLQRYENVQFPQHYERKKNILVKEKPQHEKTSIIQTGKKKEKKLHFYYSRKKRNLIYNRLHNENNAEETDSGPDNEIPSYKAKISYTRARNKTTGTIIDIILNQTFGAIDKIELAKERKRVPYFAKYLIQEVCYKLVNDLENKQKTEAVKFNLDILFDRWEYEIYKKKKIIINERLNEISELIVTSEINNAVSFLHYEDYVCACLVRDAFAESLHFLKVPTKKNKQKLNSIFFQYHLPKYDFEKKGSANLHIRKRRLQREQKAPVKVANNRYEPKKSRKKSSRLKFMKNIVDDIINGEEFLDKILQSHNNKIIFPVNKINKASTSDYSFNQSLVENEVCILDEYDNQDDREKVEPVTIKTSEVAEKFRRVKVRLSVLDIWQRENVKLKTMERRKSLLFNKVNYEEEQTFDNDEIDVNILYEIEKNEEKTVELLDPDIIDESDLIESKLELPPIEEEVKLALKTSLLPTVINPVKQRLKCVIENQVDPKLELNNLEKNFNNDENDVKEIQPDTTVKPIEKNRKVSIESGFLSYNEDNHSNNEFNSFLEHCDSENEKNLQDIFKQIPVFDRDFYLNQWIVHGVNLTNLSSELTKNIKSTRNQFSRKVYHKRPVSAESESNIFEITPVNQTLNQKPHVPGRLNSANSNRSGVSSKCYSGRSTSMSAVAYNMSDSEETTNSAPQLNKKQINTKIEFFVPEKIYEEKKENNAAAWDFYLKRKQDKRHLEQYESILKGVNIEGSELYVNEKLLLLNEEKEEILKNFSKTLLSYSNKNDDEVEVKLLRPSETFLRPLESNDNQFEGEIKHNESDVEIERIMTPWKPLRHRPLTPDSVDSDEEVKKMKNIYIETMNKKKAFDEDKQSKASFLELKRKQLDIAKSAWKKHSNESHIKEALEANRELFLKLEINLKNNSPKRLEPIKRFSIAEPEGISKRLIEKQKEKNINEHVTLLNKRAKSTPKSFSNLNYKSDCLFPCIPKVTSVVGSSEDHRKKKIAVRNTQSSLSETKPKSTLSFTKSKSSLNTIDAKNKTLFKNGSKTLR
ncbi:uncharacterized protein LOC101240025 isoform X1 [Hydra vulgaris]|uniref:uncharacterized protein LOC101240025 isoform X1 n=1 Tax=Hydra vulgaris TaxID=6087 RepID=UPI001F5F9160|nr:uncharacterized protein LOC101240025 [Hydra vulgaris]